jgi:hypothetical protein
MSAVWLMGSLGLWRWYVNITITFQDIIYCPVFYTEVQVSETGFYLRLHVEPTQLGTIDKASLCLWNNVSVTGFCLTGRGIMSRIVIVM